VIGSLVLDRNPEVAAVAQNLPEHQGTNRTGPFRLVGAGRRDRTLRVDRAAGL
jgi:hypothetical protein